MDRMSNQLYNVYKLRIMLQLDNSTKKFKIVVGHHTWRSVAGHGNAERVIFTPSNDLFKAPILLCIYAVMIIASI